MESFTISRLITSRNSNRNVPFDYPELSETNNANCFGPGSHGLGIEPSLALELRDRFFMIWVLIKLDSFYVYIGQNFFALFIIFLW